MVGQLKKIDVHSLTFEQGRFVRVYVQTKSTINRVCGIQNQEWVSFKLASYDNLLLHVLLLRLCRLYLGKTAPLLWLVVSL